MVGKIDRKQAENVFREYAERYDLSDEMIRLKAEHTYRVADLCDRIARSIELPEAETDLAWLIGLLHDIGRFEQQRRYHTFIDADSIDHARCSVDVLFGEGKIREFLEDGEEDEVIREAVAAHNKYRIPDGLDERTCRFANILRDADKIDIARVNVEFPLEEIYHVSHEELYSGRISPEVMESFREGHAVLRSLIHSAVDHVVGHISMAYELVYPLSRKIMGEQGYLNRLMEFSSENPETGELFREIREKMGEFLRAV